MQLRKLQQQQQYHERQEQQLEDRHSKDVARLSNDLRKTKALLAASAEDVATVENKLTQVKEASKKTLLEMSTEFKRHEETNKRLRREIMALQKRVKTAEEHSTRTEESSAASSNQLRAKADSLQQSLSALQKEHAQLQRQQQPLTAELSECKKQLAASMIQAETRARQSDAEITQLQEQLRKVSDELAQATGHTSVNEKRFIERANKLQAELQNIQAKTLWKENDLNMQLTAAQTELRDTADKLQRKTAKVKTMKERIASLGQQLSQSKQDANASLLQLRQQLAQKPIAGDAFGDGNYEEVERLTKRLSTVMNSKTQLEGENRQQKLAITELHASVDTMRMALEQAEDKCVRFFFARASISVSVGMRK